MKACHIFNIDSFLITLEQKVWIINKANPSEPLMRINLEEYKLIKRGVYKKKGNSSIKFGNEDSWISADMKKALDKLTKGNEVDFGFSLIEYTDSDIIGNSKRDINLKPFKHLKNSGDDIILISTKMLKNKYGHILTELTDSLNNQGLIIKNIYYLNETFLSQSKDDNITKIMNVLVTSLIGREEENSKLTDSVTKYDKVYYYDGNENIIYSIAYQINDWINFLKSKYTKIDLTSDALDLIKITTNELNPLKKIPFEIYISSLIMKYENFSKFTSKYFLPF